MTCGRAISSGPDQYGDEERTNDFSGTMFFSTRDNSFVGTQADQTKFNPGTFQIPQPSSGSIGGRHLQQIVLLRNYETTVKRIRNDLPGVRRSRRYRLNVTRVLASDLDSLSRFLKNSFNYVPVRSGIRLQTPSERFLARLDYNLNEHNKFNLRYTLLNSTTDVLVSNSNSLGFGNRRTSLDALNFRELELRHSGKPALGRRRMELDAGDKSNNLILGYNTSNESRKNVDGPLLLKLRFFRAAGATPHSGSSRLPRRTSCSTTAISCRTTLVLSPETFGDVRVSVEKYHSKNVFFQGAQAFMSSIPGGLLRRRRQFPRESGTHDVAGHDAAVSVPLLEHLRADGAGPAARCSVCWRVHAG